MGILSNLKNFGINIESDIYEENKSKEATAEAARLAEKEAAEAKRKAEEEKKKKLNDEQTYLLAKSYTCPVCNKPFKSLAVKANRARVVDNDIDMRPIYEPVDMLKYTIVSCPYCGYSALTRSFPNITVNQQKLVKEKISKNFLSKPEDNERIIYTYEEALERYELAFATAMAITAKTSEKAYLCLSMSWLVRGERKNTLTGDEYDYIKMYDDYKSTEKELQQKALEGFLYAVQTENFPMCGSLDQQTVDYIIAAMYYKTREFDKSMKILSEVIVSASTNKRVKEKARDLKERILAIKASNNSPSDEEMGD
ncbi:MAG: DUF2225 domain-containing protein [Lachnospiraceae bacterium]|nr:DUF2225 domain-containing protein [Lachnospiraceae bacterium]